VSRGATTTLMDSGVVLDTPLDLNQEDPTKPVEGTTTQRPLSETKTEIQPETMTPNMTPAFTLDGGPFKPTTTGSRPFTSLRLARARLRAGMVIGDDLLIAEAISGSVASEKDMQREIETLDAVHAASRKNASRADAGNGIRPAPRQASRTTPSLAPSAEGLRFESSVAYDETLFEG